jgi:hypothetical protein
VVDVLPTRYTVGVSLGGYFQSRALWLLASALPELHSAPSESAFGIKAARRGAPFEAWQALFHPGDRSGLSSEYRLAP